MAFQSSSIFLSSSNIKGILIPDSIQDNFYLRGIPTPTRQFVLCLTPFKSTKPRSANLAVPEVMSEGRSGSKVNQQGPPPYLGRTVKSP